MNQNAQRALLTQPLPWTAAALCSLLCIILAGPSKFNGGSPSRALGPPCLPVCLGQSVTVSATEVPCRNARNHRLLQLQACTPTQESSSLLVGTAFFDVMIALLVIADTAPCLVQKRV